MRRVDVVTDREEMRARAWRSIVAGGRKGGNQVCLLVAQFKRVSERYKAPTERFNHNE